MVLLVQLVLNLVENELFKTEEITAAPRTRIRPKKAFLIVSLACSIESGLPDEVMYSYPPFIRNKVANREATTNRTFRVWFVNEDTSGLPAASAGLKLAKKIALKNARIVNNFMYAFY